MRLQDQNGASAIQIQEVSEQTVQSEVKIFLTSIASKMKSGMALQQAEADQLHLIILLYEDMTDLQTNKQGTLVGLIADELNEAQTAADTEERDTKLAFVFKYLKEIA